MVFLTEDAWYCSDECAAEGPANQPDHKALYTKAVVWRGLQHMCRLDAERENDGDGLMAFWKFDMFDFWTKRHYKYLGLAHRFIAGKHYSPILLLVKSYYYDKG